MSKIPSVQSLERAFALLEAFAPNNSEQGISDLSRRVNLPRPTVSRLVATLESLGYLRQNKVTKKYSLGPKLLYLGTVVQAGFNLMDVAAPVLHKLRDELKETVYIDVIDGDERVCIASLPGLHAVRTVVDPGQRSPLYAGADSRMLLSSLSDDQIEAYLKRVRMKPFAPHTVTDPEKLLELVKEIRAKGYSFSVGEFHSGSACISAPVRDSSGNITAALSVSFPEMKVRQPYIDSYRLAVTGAALEMSRQMGYTG
ncbi:MAG: IclR family transcriptional regulator [Bacillota bacterium]